ncbi:hypothetical protein BYI23_B010910 [Burkholderia sp. YI23]|nr:hypothetical protein BYI23_B010910 [Burkholderia sp. YI23]
MDHRNPLAFELDKSVNAVTATHHANTQMSIQTNTTTNALIPASLNAALGFNGTMAAFYSNRATAQRDVNEAWTFAIRSISLTTQAPFERARAFLDKAHGQRFANDALTLVKAGRSVHEAIAETALRWQHPASRKSITLGMYVIDGCRLPR